MNSMLQCLSNTQALTLHFLRDDEAYKEDINEDNPLGCGGRIAIAYANLLKEMWSGEFSVVSPSAFKTVIGEFSPQFSGYQQQDSQELMNALLDGLHEDLNKVLRKPYVETVDSNGRPDDVVSREAWTNHLRRNDSIVNDLCFGQMKSHITCVSCGATSVTFDPYSLLSLPIPIDTSKTLKLPVFRFNGMERSDITISVDFSRTVLELKAAIAAELQMKRDVSTLAICALTRTNDGTYGRVTHTP